MRLIEIRKPAGTYFGVRPTAETVHAMQEFMGDHRIPNPLDSHKMHATVVYSRSFVGARPHGKLNPTWKGDFTDFDIFNTKSKIDESEAKTGRCLVLKFDCDQLHERHHQLRKEHGATHDFPSYEPHITFSYDVGEFDHHNLPAYDGPHEFGEEYSEPLDLNYVK